MVTIRSREGKEAISLPQHMSMSIYAHAYNAQNSGKITISIVWETEKLVSSQTCGKRQLIKNTGLSTVTQHHNCYQFGAVAECLK